MSLRSYRSSASNDYMLTSGEGGSNTPSTHGLNQPTQQNFSILPSGGDNDDEVNIDLHNNNSSSSNVRNPMGSSSVQTMRINASDLEEAKGQAV